MWSPVALANEVVTLDVVSGGRAVLGVGAGHTPQEWTSTGRRFPSPGERVGRMIELVNMTHALLNGEVVSRRGDHFTLVDATLSDSAPAPHQIPLLIGGNGTRLLRFAAQRADIVGVSGLKRTLADGHRHEVDWSPAALRRIADVVGSASAAEGRRPAIEALVQHVEITDDAAEAAEALKDHVPGASVDDLLEAPFIWIGTVEKIREKLRRHEAELGIQRYVVRAPALAYARRIIEGAV